MKEREYEHEHLVCGKCAKKLDAELDFIMLKYYPPTEKEWNAFEKNFAYKKKSALQKLKYCEILRPKKSLKDIVLTPHTREQVELIISTIDKSAVLFHTWGLNDVYQYGKALAVNFVGLPGTGKTLCAEVLAKETGKKLVKVNYSQLTSYWIGVTEKRISKIFKEAQNENAILFFDEADSIASKRVSVGTANDSYYNQEINVLLRELEKFSGIVIFATNLPENMDPAMERRIALHVLFEIPRKEERVELFKKLVPKKMPIENDMDWPKLAEKMFVGGDIKNIVFNAARIAVHEGAEKVGMKHFEKAIHYVEKNKKLMYEYEENAEHGRSVV